MKQSFDISYLASGLPITERPLSAALVEHHMSCLPADLEREDSLIGLAVKTNILLQGLTSTAVVVLTATGEAIADPADALTEALVRINNRASGLCFVMARSS